MHGYIFCEFYQFYRRQFFSLKDLYESNKHRSNGFGNRHREMHSRSSTKCAIKFETKCKLRYRNGCATELVQQC